MSAGSNGWKSGSMLERVLKSGEFVVTAELGPPKNADAAVVRKKARLLQGYCEGANITDNQTAIVRMSSIAAGAIALSEGIEPIIQMTCRDRNRLAMQADLLGAYALGLRNILCLSGDHQKFGNHATAKNVFDIDSMQLLQIVAMLRDAKKFACGEDIKGTEPRFFVGAAENPFGDPFEWRPLRLAKKARAGADFIQTQLVYNVEKFKTFMGMVRDLGVDKQLAILPGVGPLKSPGMTRYMKNEVPGLDVPDEVLARMQGTPKDKWREEGIKICVEIIQQMREIPGVAGVHIMAIEWEEAVGDIVKQAGLYPRPEAKVEAAAQPGPVAA